MIYVNNPHIWKNKIQLLLKIIPEKLKKLDSMKEANENTTDIEAEICGLMLLQELYSFAVFNNSQVDEELKSEVRTIYRKASSPLFGRCPNGRSEEFCEPLKTMIMHYDDIKNMNIDEVMKKLGE